MSDVPFLFDAVLFDLDGTLVSTELFWVEAAREGARRAFAELGIERDMPDAEAWLSMVGLPLARGFELVFADLEPAARARVMALCVEEEERALRAGGAALMPGAREVLSELRAAGLKLGIASNCGRGYLQSMLGDLDLGNLVDEARCLDSHGVHSKSDMIADLLATFGTRRALMVGDRSGDAEAAHQNALPHVHLEGPIRPRAERVECEARIAALVELPDVLRGRARWIGGALDALGLGGASLRTLRCLGVTGALEADGPDFARDAARLLTERGREVRVLDARAFGVPDAAGADDPAGWADELDVERLIARVLEPHAAGRPVAADDAGGAPLDPDALLVLEGPWLLHPRLRLFLDRALYLTVPEEVSLTRAAARAAERAAEVLVDLRRRALPRQRDHEEHCDPAARADLVLDARNVLGTVPGQNIPLTPPGP
ncbi:MAG TPA: HAD hydrolase-like protein, partial [Planctomycetota bacterium]|nr:HAD hydrolase-like protein [Planctomycetota bacterium]